MSTKINTIIQETLTALSEDFGKPELAATTLTTVLYGQDGLLTSIELVTLISDLEDRMMEQYNIGVILADEKAMSQRNSPFKSIENLAQFIEAQLQENQVTL